MALEAGQLPVGSSQKLLEEVARSELDSDDFALTLTAGSAIGDNYIGVLFRARAECRRSGRALNIIVKLPPQNEARRNQFFAHPAFEREIYFYDTIYPVLEEFQREKGIELEAGDGFYQVPRCLKTCVREYEEAIFMADLKQEGFEMFDRHKEQGLEHFRLVVKTLGKLHALSFALRDQQPERFEPFRAMVELFTTRDDDASMEQWFQALVTRALETLDEKTEPEVYEKTRDALKVNFLDHIRELTKGASAEPYAVICHGDCWNNNVMFKHDEHDTPVDIRLLDWQICRYASPVLDLMYFLFTASTKAFRDAHYEDLLQLYHDTLSTFLRRLGSDPEVLFPRSALDDQLVRFGRFGLLMAAMLLPIITTKSEDIPDLDGMAEKLENGFDVSSEINNFKSEGTQDIYREKMAGCCRDMVRLGYI